MKALYLFNLIALFLFGGNSLNAQNDDNNKNGGIFWLYVHMSDELTTEYKRTNNSRIFLNSYSESAIFPDNLLDSIRTKAELLCSEKFQADVKCIYKKSKKGKLLTSIGANGEIEGMPSNNFKGARSSAEMDYYIKLNVMMHSGGKAVIVGDKKMNTIRPIVNAYIVAYDKEKNVVWKNKVTREDFSTLRSIERTDGDITITESETLGPNDIYMIYKIVLTALFKKD